MMNTVNKLKAKVMKPPSVEMTLMSPDGTEKGAALSTQEPVQVEPKTYFANERTFIQWISASLLLLTVSSIMMGSGSYNGTSSVIAFCALILVLYASFVYFRRVKLLRSGDAYGYLDFIGPSILACGVGLGVFIVFADAVKGSEFLPFGVISGDHGDDRRFLMSSSRALSQMPEEPVRPVVSIFELQEVDGTCSRHSLEGINLLEYEPRDIILKNKNKQDSELIVATPQALVSHPLSEHDKASSSAILSEIPDTEIQSMTMVGDRLFALSTGPSKTEVIIFNPSDQYADVESRFLIQESTSTTGSMVYLPSLEAGKLYIYIDGAMHSYHLLFKESSVSLSRTSSINMKVLNRGLVDNDDPITAMEHFEGLTYILRERQNTVEAWDLNSATLLAEMALPSVSKNDKWVGMAFERRKDDAMEENSQSLLRKSKVAADNDQQTDTSVYLHMPIDTFPPQLWSFRLEEHQNAKDDERSVLSFPECNYVSKN